MFTNITIVEANSEVFWGRGITYFFLFGFCKSLTFNILTSENFFQVLFLKILQNPTLRWRRWWWLYVCTTWCTREQMNGHHTNWHLTSVQEFTISYHIWKFFPVNFFNFDCFQKGFKVWVCCFDRELFEKKTLENINRQKLELYWPLKTWFWPFTGEG